MIRIQDFVLNEQKYEIYLSKDTQTKAQEIGIHNGIILGAAARLINRLNKKYNTYYFAEQNVLFYVEAEEPNKLFFLDIKRLNIFENKKVTSLKDPINEVEKPTFFKSYDDGRRVYLNGNLPLKMKKMSIPPHFISLKNIFVPEGHHSMFENGVIVDFYFSDEGKYFITNILKPDFVNFGLAVLKN